jgi:hypothetical protein
MAPGQHIALAGPSIVVRIVGQLVVTNPNVTIEGVRLTQHVSVSGRDCTNLAISNIQVTNDTVAVHVSGPRDGLGSIDATGSLIENVAIDGPNTAVVAIVNAVGGPNVTCANAADLVVRDDPKPQPREQIKVCTLLSLSDIFQIYGSKMELKLMHEERPAWMATLQYYNWYATQAAALALIAFVTVKGPDI